MTVVVVPTAADHGEHDEPRAVSSPRSRLDIAFRSCLLACAGVVIVLILLIVLFLGQRAVPALRNSGLSFFSTSLWQPGAQNRYGVLGDLLGTVTMGLLALFVALPISIASALGINEYVPPGLLRRALITLMDLLAAVPSIVYGLWGVMVFVPWMNGTTIWLTKWGAFFPLFHPSSGLVGRSLFDCSLVVAIMITPIITSVSREVMSQAPREQCEGALALGGTKWGMITDVVVPYARNGIIGAALLGLGRAMGETMAVTLILSTTNAVTGHILYPGGGTIPALIVNWFDQVGPGPGLNALTLAGLTLFAMALIVNIIARLVVSRSSQAV